MPESHEIDLVAALERLLAGEATGDDLLRLRQAVAEGRITLTAGQGDLAKENIPASGGPAVVQSGGVHFGQSNQIHISGSAIGSLTLNLPSAAEALRLLDSLQPFQPEQPPSMEVLPEPGPLPPGSCLPFPRNAVFTGRVEALKWLASSLLPPEEPVSETGQRAVAATGTGGLGKTQLAAEFCYRYGRYFHGVHWLHADQDMTAEIAACGAAMGLQPWPEALPEQAAVILQAWERGGSRLVVMDNVDEVEVVQEWLPRLGRARVLITSRQGDWPPDLGVELLALDSLPRPDSLGLLRKLAPRLDKASDDELERVAERLGDLPLALDLAGRYLGDRRGLSPGDFLAELEQAGSALAHSALRDWTRHNPTQHATSLAATFSLSWDRLACLGGPQDCLPQRLSCAAGYCAANTPIPWDVFYQLEKVKDGLAQAEIDKALGDLDDGGLVKITEGGPVVHPLLGEFARLQDVAGQGSILPRIAEALDGLAEQAAQNEIPEKFKPLRPHVERTAGWAEQKRLEPAGSLWHSLGSHLDIVSEFHGAKAALERALHADQAFFGSEHPNVARDIRTLGEVLRELGDYAAAQAAHERALRIDEASFGPEHPLVARDVNDQGLVLHELGDYIGAKAAFERALSIDEAALGPDHPDVAMIINNLGRVLADLGDLSGAKACLERAVRIEEAANGPDHPHVAANLNNLGEVMREMGDYQGARLAYERALRIADMHFGPDHPVGAIYLNNLGGLFFVLGDYVGAKAAFEQTLHILEAVMGPEHPDIAIRVNNLGVVLRQQGDYSGAKEAFERAVRIDETAFGRDHPEVATDLNNLGAVLQMLGQYAQAQAACDRALRIDQAAYGLEHTAVARDVVNLGQVLQARGDYSEAKAAFERALAIDEAALGPEHPDVARDVNYLGEALNALGDYAGAKAAIERALAIDEAVLGLNHPNLARDVNNLGLVLISLGDEESAVTAIQRALRIDEAVFGLDHPNVARDLQSLGRVLQQMGDHSGSQAAYQRALAIYEKSLPPDHPRIETVRGDLDS